MPTVVGSAWNRQPAMAHQWLRQPASRQRVGVAAQPVGPFGLRLQLAQRLRLDLDGDAQGMKFSTRSQISAKRLGPCNS